MTTRFLTGDELALLKVLADGQARRPSQIARELGEHSSGYTASLLQRLRAPEMGLVRSQYIKTGDPNDWGLWAITGLGEAEVYARENPQLDLSELDARFAI